MKWLSDEVLGLNLSRFDFYLSLFKMTRFITRTLFLLFGIFIAFISTLKTDIVSISKFAYEMFNGVQ